MSDRDNHTRRWRKRRFIYYVVLALLFSAIAFYFGPNMFMFGKLTWITPADFSESVRHETVEVVRAAKRYQRHHGSLPERTEQLVPQYLQQLGRTATVWNGEVSQYTKLGHTIRYRFTPGDEGWWVMGPFVIGRIPLPPVDALPVTQRTSQPN